MRRAFHNMTKTALRLAAGTTAVAGLGWAQMGPDESLPEEPSATEQSLQEAHESADGAVGGDGQEAASAERSDEDGPTWESYNSDTNESVAQEVTQGVRVEDIVEPPTDFRYAAFGKADPFVPPLVTADVSVAAVAGVDPLEIPIVSPLQRFALADLNVVGVWQVATGERKAMIFAQSGDGAGQGIIVRNGDPVGNRGGKILAIGDTYVTVREFNLAPDGTRQYEDQQLFMGGRDADDVTGKLRFTPGAKNPEVLIDGGVGAVLPGGAGTATDAPANGAPAAGVQAPGPAQAGAAGLQPAGEGAANPTQAPGATPPGAAPGTVAPGALAPGPADAAAPAAQLGAPLDAGQPAVNPQQPATPPNPAPAAAVPNAFGQAPVPQAGGAAQFAQPPGSFSP